MKDVKETPLVSVITVTYNREKLLGRCMKSVLNQSYQNIEYILIDSGSTDNSDEVVRGFLSDSRLRYVRLDENRNNFLNYNYGATLANGKYITYLDSDDEYVQNKIEKQVELIEKLPEEYGLVYCWMTYFDSSKNNSIDHVHKTELKGFVALEASIRPSVSGTPTLLIRREAFWDCGGFDIESKMTSDWEFCARFCHKWKVDYVPESLVNVYINHIYERLSVKMRYDKSLLKNRIALHEHFLEEFKDSYDKKQGSRWYHYKSLAFFYAKDYDFVKSFKYLVLYIISSIKSVF